MHDHALALSYQALVDLGIAALYLAFAVRAVRAWRAARRDGVASDSGAFLAALAAVFGFCGLSGYALHMVALVYAPWAEAADTLRAVSSTLLLLSTVALVVLEYRHGYLERINRAESARDAAEARARVAGVPAYVLDSPALVVRADIRADGTAVYHEVSRGFAERLGTTRARLRGAAIRDLVHPDDRDATADAVRTRAARGDVDGFRNRYRIQLTGEPEPGRAVERDALGVWVWFEWRHEPDPNGWAYPEDVTALVQMERAAETEKRRADAAEADINAIGQGALGYLRRTP